MNGAGCQNGKADMEIPPVLPQGDAGEHQSIRLAAGITLGALAIGIFGAPYLLGSDVLPECVMLQALDLPCLFCGGTRSFAALARLEILAALRLNPFAAVAAIAIFAGGLACLKAPEIAGTRVKWGWIWMMLGAGLLANWCYLIFYLPR